MSSRVKRLQDIGAELRAGRHSLALIICRCQGLIAEEISVRAGKMWRGKVMRSIRRFPCINLRGAMRGRRMRVIHQISYGKNLLYGRQLMLAKSHKPILSSNKGQVERGGMRKNINKRRGVANPRPSEIEAGICFYVKSYIAHHHF